MICGFYPDFLFATLLHICISTNTDAKHQATSSPQTDVYTCLAVIFLSCCCVYPIYLYSFLWRSQKTRAWKSIDLEHQAATDIIDMYKSHHRHVFYFPNLQHAKTAIETGLLVVMYDFPVVALVATAVVSLVYIVVLVVEKPIRTTLLMVVVCVRESVLLCVYGVLIVLAWDSKMYMKEDTRRSLYILFLVGCGIFTVISLVPGVVDTFRILRFAVGWLGTRYFTQNLSPLQIRPL